MLQMSFLVSVLVGLVVTSHHLFGSSVEPGSQRNGRIGLALFVVGLVGLASTAYFA